MHVMLSLDRSGGANRSPEFESIREQLLRRKAELLAATSQLEEEARTLPGDRLERPSLANHPAELASDAYNEEVAIGLLENRSEELREVALALDRLERGTYGFCEECRRRIDIERLRAVPEARLCLACKLEDEKYRG